MKRGVLVVLAGAIMAAGCGGGGGGGSSTGANTCGDYFAQERLCDFSCTAGSRTSLAEGTALLDDVATPYLNEDGTTTFAFDCTDDGTANGYMYMFTFGEGDFGLQSIYYDGSGTYAGGLPACVLNCTVL